MTNQYNLPPDRKLAPRADNSQLDFVVSDDQSIDMAGDLESLPVTSRFILSVGLSYSVNYGYYFNAEGAINPSDLLGEQIVACGVGNHGPDIIDIGFTLGRQLPGVDKLEVIFSNADGSNPLARILLWSTGGSAYLITDSELSAAIINNLDNDMLLDIITPVEPEVEYLPLDGSEAMTGDLYMNGNKQVKDMGDPTEPQDATTKSYVDTNPFITALRTEVDELKTQMAALQAKVANL